MKLEESLQKYLNQALESDPIYSCEMSFYRDLTKEELSYMNKQIEHQKYIFICFHCDTCIEYTNGKEPYHIDRIMDRDKWIKS
ncbi:hypothetical protein AB3N02_21955 [Priestia aryabhattai]|uniref:hypothetical protein n=1 Tax=Priestia aryabhattai TaxID=412384 RepID=UPI0039A1D734